MQPHEMLGLEPGASRDEITRAFRRFVLGNHPDRGGDPARFQAGVEAYRRLVGGSPAGGGSAPANVVFHRRARTGVPSLLRLAGRRLAAFRSQI